MLNIIQERWNEILEKVRIEHSVTEVSFRTWLKPLQVHSVNDNVIILLVSDAQLGTEFVSKKYSVPLKVAIEEVIGKAFELKFVLPNELNNLSTKQSSTTQTNNVPSVNTINPNLNPRYTFDTFVVGANNNLAHAASLAVAESPGEMYNPLFIYGGVGLGKTHLMHSIAHFILEKNPDAKVLYVTSEKFTNELIESIGNKNDNTPIKFREKYRNIDVLLIDDIQFIIGKERTQMEFFHTFNTLHEAKKQIIISSDKPPKEIETLEERLRSRFEMGLTVDVQSPDYETRMAILRKKEELDGLNIDSNVLEFIAANIKSNIRELEGALTRLVAFSRLNNGREIDVEMAESELKDFIYPNENKKITVELIIDIVSEHYEISSSDILSSKKSKNIAFPRQICMYLCRNLTEFSLEDIGKSLGNRDHTTILYGIQKIEKDIKTDRSLQNTIEVLIKKISPQ